MSLVSSENESSCGSEEVEDGVKVTRQHFQAVQLAEGMG